MNRSVAFRSLGKFHGVQYSIKLLKEINMIPKWHLMCRCQPCLCRAIDACRHKVVFWWSLKSKLLAKFLYLMHLQSLELPSLQEYSRGHRSVFFGRIFCSPILFNRQLFQEISLHLFQSPAFLAKGHSKIKAVYIIILRFCSTHMLPRSILRIWTPFYQPQISLYS